MHSMLIWPALGVLAAVVTSIPAVHDGGNRTVLYWLVLPSLLVGAAAAAVTHLGGF